MKATITIEREVTVVGRYFKPFNGDEIDPPEPATVEDIVATLDDGHIIELTADEYEQAIDAIIEVAQYPDND